MAWLQQARRQLRRMTGRTNAQGEPERDATEPDEIPPPPTQIHRPTPLLQTRDELEASSDEQTTSLFFSRLPLELRRMIYNEVWREALDGRDRIHLDSLGVVDGPLKYVPCVVGDVYHGGGQGPSHSLSGIDGSEAVVIGPQPGKISWAQSQLIRLHWAAHADCARAGHAAWQRQDGAPFMSLFLTCKRIYTESITTLFATTTFVFQSSLNANVFFTPAPDVPLHRYFPLLRALEVNVAYDNDHIFLHSVQMEGHPRLPVNVTVGMEAWEQLLKTLAAAVPELERLDMLIGGTPPSGREALSDVFTAVGWKPSRLNLRFSDR